MRSYNAWRAPLAAAAFIFCGATMASATTLQITVTNNQAPGGLSITPLYLGFHDGSFDAFDEGEAASEGLELIAETGIPSTAGTVGTPIEGTTGVAQERLAQDPNSSGVVIGSPSGPPPIQPGEVESVTVELNPTSGLFLTYLAMLLPSNDHFIGNDDALRLFADDGSFLGDRVIRVTGESIYDAGTEANGLEGVAFVPGQDIFLSPDGEGEIQQGIPLSDELVGVLLPDGNTLDGSLIDFISDPASFDLLTIEIREISAVPLPASAPMLLAGLGLLGLARRGARQKS